MVTRRVVLGYYANLAALEGQSIKVYLSNKTNNTIHTKRLFC